MKRKPPPLTDAPRSLRVELVKLEVASGYDGLFRGAPEPVIVVGAYAVDVLRMRPPATVLRGVFRVKLPHERYPLVAEVSGRQPAAPRARVIPRGCDVLLLAAAVEDDGGDGVSQVYGAFERASELAVASVEAGDDTQTLAEIGAEKTAWRSPRRARIIVDGMPLESRVKTDDWVGAAAVRFPKLGRVVEHRLHLAADDFVNDWTALVIARFGA